jgi:hypothetical protein
MARAYVLTSRYREELDLGLTRPGEGYPNILLVDAARSRVYRPLTLTGPGSHCLCTPVTHVQQNLRLDFTTLLQVAFPPLPPDVENVDVQLATVPPFWQVPVTPAGMLPLASYPTDLIAPVEPTSVLASTKAFRYGPAGQHYLVMINRVSASSSFTSIAWTILALEPGRGLQTASSPPFADADPPVHPYNEISAGGPQVRLGDQVLRARLVTTKLAGRGALECLCTDLRIGAAVSRGIGQQISVAYQPATAPTRHLESCHCAARFDHPHRRRRDRGAGRDVPLSWTRRAGFTGLDLWGGPATFGLGTS